jgi:glycosyltransferase involved in cell wall biosynthesis
MRILYYGPFRDGSGYAIAARGYLRAFDKLIKAGEDIELRLMTLDLEGKNSRLSKEDIALVEKYEIKFDKHTGETSEEEVSEWIKNPEPYMFIWHQPAPMISWERYYEDSFWDNLRKAFKAAKWNVTFTVWEADKIHESWVDTYDIYDINAVVVPSKYNYETFLKGLKNQKPFYIPHPVEENTADTKPITGLPNLDDKFIIFSMSQWGIRKGFDKLILAYGMEFGHQQDTLLLIKTNGNIMNSAKKDEQQKLIHSDVTMYKKMIYLDAWMEQPTCDIAMITDYLPYENIQWLYDQATVFCLPARAEGFGLTIAEAIVNKIPIITTRQTGQKEFISEEHPFIIEGTWESYFTKSEFHAGMNAFEPSLNSLREKLRQAYKTWRYNSSDLSTIAKEQLDYFKACDYSLERVANDLLAMAKEVCV